jgi:hypothetical protein
MPRLFGYRERADTDLWDSFNPKEFLDDTGSHPRVWLFGNRNIGITSRCNLQIAGQLSLDQTLVILSWYARTNLSEEPHSPDFSRAWHAWINATNAELVVGRRPVRQVPLVNLLGPREFGNLCGARTRDNNHDSDTRSLAEKMYREYVSTLTPDKVRMTNREAAKAFSDLTQQQRDMWLSAAAVYPFCIPVIVPVRQNFGVHVYADRKATEVLLKVMPENVAPMPLVWVHLAGLMTRDVA